MLALEFHLVCISLWNAHNSISIRCKSPSKSIDILNHFVSLMFWRKKNRAMPSSGWMKSACFFIPTDKTHQGAAQSWIISVFCLLWFDPRSTDLYCNGLVSASVRRRGLAWCARGRRARATWVILPPGKKAKLGQTSAIVLCHLLRRCLGPLFVFQFFCKMRFIDR